MTDSESDRTSSSQPPPVEVGFLGVAVHIFFFVMELDCFSLSFGNRKSFFLCFLCLFSSRFRIFILHRI